MKLKFAIATFGLAAILGLGVGSGLKAHKVETAKAVDDDKMISVVIDLNDALGYDKFHKPEVHYYGTGIDKYEDLHQLTGTYYTANLPYISASQTIDHIQFLFKQGTQGVDEVDKWSNSIELSVTQWYVYHFAFAGTWTGDNWDVTKDSWNGQARVRGNAK